MAELKKLRRWRTSHYTLVIIPFLMVAGCGKPPYELAPVQGRVTIGGQAMSKGRVVFAPVGDSGSISSGKPAFGVIQPDGSYALRTYRDNDGAVVGNHAVTIYDTGDSPKFSRLLLPGHHAVAAGEENRIDISITRDDIRRYGWTDSANE